MERFDDRSLLKQTREGLGLSQRALSEISGQPKWVIADFESGRRLMKGPRLQSIWDALAATDRAWRSSRVAKSIASVSVLLQGTSADGTSEAYRQSGELGYGQSSALKLLKQQLQIANELIAKADRLMKNDEAIIAELMKELRSLESEPKAQKIVELQKQNAKLAEENATLRALYDAGTEAALANARFEELREKVSMKDEKE